MNNELSWTHSTQEPAHPSSPGTALELDSEGGNEGEGNHHSNGDSGSLAIARDGQKLGEPRDRVRFWTMRHRVNCFLDIPERPNEAPDLSHKGDEDANTSGIGPVAVDGVCDEHSGDDLVAWRTPPSQKTSTRYVEGREVCREARSLPAEQMPAPMSGVTFHVVPA